MIECLHHGYERPEITSLGTVSELTLQQAFSNGQDELSFISSIFGS